MIDKLKRIGYNKSTKSIKGNTPKELEMKKIDEVVVYVTFNFGGGAYVGVNLYEGKTFEECIRLRSENIDGYIENGKYIKL